MLRMEEQPVICQRGFLHHVSIPPVSSSSCINLLVNMINSSFVGQNIKGFNPLFDPLCIWGNEISLSPLQVKNMCKVAQSRKKLLKKNKLFVYTVKKTAANYRMV